MVRQVERDGILTRCAGGDHTAELTDRESVAERLLVASRRHSFDPDSDVDWTAPIDPDLFFMPPQCVSLYETPMWDRLDHGARVELSKQEAASAATIGIWFEVILVQLLARHVYDEDLTSKHVAYALTEIADECRHSVMFGRMIDTIGAPAYRPRPLTHLRGRLLKTVAGPAPSFAAILIAEEILDTFQRATFPDEGIQPIVRDVTRIHVIEEARHVRYAREELKRQMAACSPAERELTRWVTARAAQTIAGNLVHPGCYPAVGLDARTARRAARASPHR
ncbi:MAG: AurF N-oxygenase family protein, partial [Carbonactinosporaceae bacterium]